MFFESITIFKKGITKMNASLKNIDEKNLLEQLNSMGEEEIADFRRKNQEHDEKIAQRTVRNFISLVL